jgi:hypothetical protein
VNVRTLDPPRSLTKAERQRLGSAAVAAGEGQVYAQLVLGPCAHPPTEDTWWARMHYECDGIDVLKPGVLALCSCPCHMRVDL